ncbi:3-hydroxy-3-methylglutaryl-coenzyme A reductase-like [Ostrea edulis]|uniref:3-hydroxy-3-methylglutaryl-coenzyme A reductase-like n=1 Tax=Ostrea edulis TaxID=37623 RepID=UPI0024AF388E|nr:3-hydroxy-3-methylglutaryl-coenzyme A reductase-like [Ostrea edulis]XP_056022910.1 3-hydroxy-3-methylglutaryl-coenzyme A reductase-like [Ostrea edulis]
MLSSLFYKHGHFCASRPWEVILATLTLSACLASVGIFTTPDRVCGWNYECEKHQHQEKGNSDHIFLSIIKLAAVLSTYLQFRNLRRFGTRYLLGISGIFTVSSSLVFSIAIIKMFGNDLSGLTEALPFFLLLIDLSKACALARFALNSKSQEEVQENIAHGMSIHGPVMTLDAICEILVIGVGTLSDVTHLEMMCFYGCLAVLANYLAFIMLYPACLALFLEVVRKRGKGQGLKHLQHLAQILHEEEKDSRPNPVTQNVKIIMSAGLLMVHFHSRFLATRKTMDMIDMAGSQYRKPDVSLWYFYIQRLFTVKADSTFTLALAIFLIVKYAFYDDNSMEYQLLMPPTNTENTESTTPEIVPKVQRQDNFTSEKVDKVEFVVGEDSSDSEPENSMTHVETQTDLDSSMYSPLQKIPPFQPPRTTEECVQILKSEAGPKSLTDEEISNLVKSKHIPSYKIESMIGDECRGVKIRRKMLTEDLPSADALDGLPYENYDGYELVNGACCENVLGYMPVPVGKAGPLILDGQKYFIPMATTEGCLVASTNRGCRALESSNGIRSVVVGDSMTRAPVVRLPSAVDASNLKVWIEDNFSTLKTIFDETSRFARLNKFQIAQAGRLLYIRFIASTGDAMGMNMLSKGSERVILHINELFPEMELLSLSGNYCTDKKPAAVNWIEGRGKSVVCDAVIPSKVVKNVLKTNVSALVDLNVNKNLIGSAMAGSIGGFNAHAANVVSAIFIATGQDPAQCVASSNCITLMEATGPTQEDLYISCTMPCIEVGTVGGGTILTAQQACLKMLGIQGPNSENPGDNAKQLARVVCGAVLAAELSLMGALAAGHLVRSHLKYNRSSMYLASNRSSIDSAQSQSLLLPQHGSSTNSLPIPSVNTAKCKHS